MKLVEFHTKLGMAEDMLADALASNDQKFAQSKRKEIAELWLTNFPEACNALTFDEVEQAGLDGSLRDI